MTKHESEAAGGTSALSEAAAALEAELRRFEQLAALARKIDLNSEHNLEKAARATAEAAESQQRVAEHVRKLVGAIAAARDRQQATAESIQLRAGELQARRAEFDEVLQEFSMLGQEAAAINQLVTQVSLPRAAGQAEPNALGDVVARLQEIQARMGLVVERAQSLSRTATERDMVDIAQQAESLQRQVHSSRNKLNLLLEKLSARA
jgi:hypothetical protein